jgi:hypothetical protein
MRRLLAWLTGIACFATASLAGADEHTPWRLWFHLDQELLAVRGGAEHISGDARTSGGASLSLWQAAYDPTIRTVGGYRLGFQDSGVSGLAREDIAIGRRFDLDSTHGIIARGGGRVHLMGDDQVLFTFIELPQAQLGYQVKVPGATPILFELTGRGGFAAAGRYNVGNGRRTIGPSPEAGANLGVGVGPVHLEGSYSQILPHGKGRGLFHVLDGTTCVHVKPLGVCADASLYSAETDAGTKGVLQLGLSVGVWLSDL